MMITSLAWQKFVHVKIKNLCRKDLHITTPFITARHFSKDNGNFHSLQDLNTHTSLRFYVNCSNHQATKFKVCSNKERCTVEADTIPA